MSETSCFVLVDRNHQDGDSVRVFLEEGQARKAMKEDAEQVVAILRNDRYEPTILKYATGDMEVYVPETGIYYEWHVIETTIK